MLIIITDKYKCLDKFILLLAMTYSNRLLRFVSDDVLFLFVPLRNDALRIG
ncbi:MAG: hypothetical protein LBH30_06360 [Prevotellaceae bacterium]|nr:hypothetical protein [Prevotellaceae bacterium]